MMKCSGFLPSSFARNLSKHAGVEQVVPSGRVGIRWLSFRLRSGQSISPGKLRDAWSHATQTNRCAVRRDVLSSSDCIYGLYAPERLASPCDAELRMRDFLTKEGYVFTMSTIRGKASKAQDVEES